MRSVLVRLLDSLAGGGGLTRRCGTWRPAIAELVKALPALLLMLAVAVINPFGIRSASDQASIDSFQRIMAAFYPAEGQKRIAVVLIDDRSLRALGLTYPPKFTLYADLIKTVKEAGAESVLLDFNLIDPRGEPSDLTALTTAMRSLPVFLTSAEENGPAQRCVSDPVQNLQVLREAAAAEPHPLIHDRGQHVNLLMPDACGKTLRPAAALAVYADFCARRGDCQESADPMFNPNAFQDRTLFIEWGRAWPAGAEAIHTSYQKLATDCPGSGPTDFLLHTVSAIAPFSSEAESAPDGCFYHALIRAEWLLAPERDPELNASALGSALAGRIVLVGGAFTALKDTGTSPTFGEVPGVFLHAMALDNLIARGDGFMSPWPKGALGALGWDAVAEFIVIAIFALSGRWIGGKFHPTGLRQALLWTTATGLAGLAIGLALSFLVWLPGWEPVNWIGIVLAGLLLAGRPHEALKELWSTSAMRIRAS